MHRYAIDGFLNLFTAGITTVLFVANRQWNSLKIVCSGATDYQVDLSRHKQHKFPICMRAMSATGQKL